MFREMKFKIVINYFLFLFIVIFFANFLSKTLMISFLIEEQLIVQTLYGHKKDFFDVVIIGPSSSELGWNSMVAWNRYGITSLNYSFPTMTKISVKHLINIISKEISPKVILVESNMLLSEYRKLKIDKKFFYETVPFIPFSLNKILLIKNFVDVYNLNLKEFFTILFPIILYHSMYDKINFSSFSRCNINDYYACLNPVLFLNKIDIERLNNSTKPGYAVNYNILEKSNILNFFKNSKTPIILFNIPSIYYFGDINYYRKNKKLLDSTINVIKSQGFTYINLTDESIIEEMNLSPSDFFDENHLNYWGAEKFTNYLAKILVDKYHLQDKRNDPNFLSWDVTAKKYINDIKKNFNKDISL